MRQSVTAAAVLNSFCCPSLLRWLVRSWRGNCHHLLLHIQNQRLHPVLGLLHYSRHKLLHDRRHHVEHMLPGRRTVERDRRFHIRAAQVLLIESRHVRDHLVGAVQIHGPLRVFTHHALHGHPRVLLLHLLELLLQLLLHHGRHRARHPRHLLLDPHHFEEPGQLLFGSLLIFRNYHRRRGGSRGRSIVRLRKHHGSAQHQPHPQYHCPDSNSLHRSLAQWPTASSIISISRHSPVPILAAGAHGKNENSYSPIGP